VFHGLSESEIDTERKCRNQLSESNALGTVVHTITIQAQMIDNSAALNRTSAPDCPAGQPAGSIPVAHRREKATEQVIRPYG
jgi:hypothetical protein